MLSHVHRKRLGSWGPGTPAQGLSTVPEESSLESSPGPQGAGESVLRLTLESQGLMREEGGATSQPLVALQ